MLGMFLIKSVLMICNLLMIILDGRIKMDAIPCEKLNEHLIVTKKYNEFDVIGIDEG